MAIESVKNVKELRRRQGGTMAGARPWSLALRTAAAWLLLMMLGAVCSPAADHVTTLHSGWRMLAASDVAADGDAISQPGFDASRWLPIHTMPATVLQVLEDDGVYKNLYFGANLESEVPHDLWKKQWWYRTRFAVPTGSEVYSLIFKGINYRADIWVNGHEVANRSQVAGMYQSFEFDVTRFVKPGEDNALAVRIIPEQALPDVNGVELADSWLDWINWNFIGYQDPAKHHYISFVPDRNAGIWKRVELSSTGRVVIRNPYVETRLPLPRLDEARLTVYCDLKNESNGPEEGTLQAQISRAGKPAIEIEKHVALPPNSMRQVAMDPAGYPQLTVSHPDLWWPYTWGKPSLYKLQLQFTAGGKVSDAKSIPFGIRQVQQFRDTDEQFPSVGRGGNFYLKVNGKDFLIRGAVYTPDLLFKHDPQRDRAIMAYTKDLGLNMLRWESKIADDDMFALADREGVPVMVGWMCCMQWEKWPQWSAEDQWVARQSLKAQIRNLRYHAAAFIWANGSDGLPPDSVLKDYHRILAGLHWQNAVVDTVSSFKRDATGNAMWSGIHMEGPYSWRPPYYWFNGQFPAPRGSCAEQGDNEVIPPYESLKKFIPAEKLWPINDVWYFHAGANNGNNTLATIRAVVDHRYGPSASAQEFAKKAQLAHYEETRAQFEDFAASGWTNHKMTLYWMLDNHWPSFFGHLFDYYLEPGGAYFGAKQGLRPLTVVFDGYATGERKTARVYAVNQTPSEQAGLKVSVKYYNLDGALKVHREQSGITLQPSTSRQVLTLEKQQGLTPVYFVRCQLYDATGKERADNVYWQSATEDDLGGPGHHNAFLLRPKQWADFTPLNTMPRAQVAVSGEALTQGSETHARITLSNGSNAVAFFLRAEVSNQADGDEILPITYSANYVTLFPHESRIITAAFSQGNAAGGKLFVRVEGYNVGAASAALSSQH